MTIKKTAIPRKCRVLTVSTTADIINKLEKIGFGSKSLGFRRLWCTVENHKAVKELLKQK